MNNQFDERLTSRIREVFDNYEDNLANEGWKELRKKYPVKRNRRPLFYWIGSAAAAVILVAVGFLTLNVNSSEDQNQVAKLSSGYKKTDISESDASEARTQTPSVISEEVQNGRRIASNRPTEKGKVSNGSFGSTSKKAKQSSSVPLGADNDVKEAAPENFIAQNDNPATMTAKEENGIALKGASQEPVLAAVSSEQPEQRKSLLDISFEEDKQVREPKSSPKRVTFGVYAGSFVSYAEGSDNKVNLGAGFSSDIALSKKLKLSTGISISQNNLAFKGVEDIPQRAMANFETAFKSNDGLRATMFNLQKYDASLLGLDIPVNLKYMLSENKNDVFFSAGFSSGTFINESYTYHYEKSSMLPSPFPEATPTATEDENKVHKSFEKFDFARMLNFSFGLSYPLGKQHKLVIEPFVKYPLKNVGEENLRFGSGGVNLKLNFQTFKNK